MATWEMNDRIFVEVKCAVRFEQDVIYDLRFYVVIAAYLTIPFRRTTFAANGGTLVTTFQFELASPIAG
jgi:hypothetical protein